MFDMENKRMVPALDRAQRIFQTIMAAPHPMGISELARHLDLGKSTVHGLLHSLTALQLLDRADESDGRFKPAQLLMNLMREALLKGPVRRAASELSPDFSTAHGLTLLTVHFLSGRALIVDAAEAPGLGVSARPGTFVPSWAGALPKILLAGTNGTKRPPWGERLAEKSPLRREAFWAEVSEARKTGVALDREEYMPGIRALAAALPQGPALEPRAAVLALGLAPALGDDRLTMLSPALLVLAESVHRRAEALRRDERQRFH
jgi:DNA-binding IclR family transcriptional regulator